MLEKCRIEKIQQARSSHTPFRSHKDKVKILFKPYLGDRHWVSQLFRFFLHLFFLHMTHFSILSL